MNGVTEYYDYIFLRCLEFYKKKEDEDDAFHSCVIVLCAAISFPLVALVGWVLHFIPVDPEYMNKYVLFLPIGISTMIWLQVRYRRIRKRDNFTALRDKWMHEMEQTRRRRGWRVVAFLFLSAIGVPIFGILTLIMIG